MIKKVAYVAHQPDEETKARIDDAIQAENVLFNDLIYASNSFKISTRSYRAGNIIKQFTETKRTAEMRALTAATALTAFTKSQVLQLVEQAIKTPNSQGLARYRPASRTGCVRLPLHNVTVEDLFANKHAAVKIEKITKRVYSFSIWINYGINTSAIWVKFLLRIDPTINGATALHELVISRRQDREEPHAHGVYVHRDQWRLEFVAEISKSREKLPEETVEFVPWLEFIPNGSFRIFEWFGSNGQSGCLELPAELAKKLNQHLDAKTMRKQSFLKAFRRVASWFAGVPVHENLEMALWKMNKFSIQSLLTVMDVWTKHRVDGDSLVFEELSVWRRNDCALSVSVSSAYKRLTNLRRTVYIQFAKDMSKMYGTVIAKTNQPLASLLSSLKDRYVKDLIGGAIVIHFLGQVGMNITDLHRKAVG